MSEAGLQAQTERNPDQTRSRILEAAFQEIYRCGYQGMRLDDVLAKTGLTKGALYHHFANKQALGYAVVDEVIGPLIESVWAGQLEGVDDPLQALIEVIRSLPDVKPAEMIQYGCPLNNLAQEMSPLDEGFRQRLDAVFARWHGTTLEALRDAQEKGLIRPEIDCDETATFVMAAMEGCIGIAKNAQSVERLRTCNHGLIQYLLSLKV